MLKIRLARLGTKQRPFYRVVVIDERSKRSGVYLELLGTYNPLTTPHEIKLKQDRVDHWVKMGAQMSDGFLRIIGKAKQRLPRKPKKASQQATGNSGQQTPKTDKAQPAEATPQETTEQPTETQPVVETPAEAPINKEQETPETEGGSEEGSMGATAVSEANEEAPREPEEVVTEGQKE